MADTGTCIICGQQAGSREHVFPAAFGGRRMDKGIYCQQHNNDFGRHVATLLASLGVFNAALGVRPDRQDAVRPAPATANDGSTYLVAKNSVAVPIPRNVDADFDFGMEQTLTFPDQSAADRWMGEQRKRGYQVKAKRLGPTRTKFFTENLHVETSIGGHEFMRALLYLSLTYLAHYFPEYARSPGLGPAKAEIQRTEDVPLNVEVWWERPSSLNQVPPNPFAAAHCVAISIEPSGEVRALVSLWGALNFGMRLGSVDPVQPIRAVTYIDPLADRAPHDIEVFLEPEGTLVLGTPDEGRAYLHEVASGVIPHPMQSLLETAGAAQSRDSATALMTKLVAAAALPSTERRDAIFEAISTESQRVFNLLKEAIDGFLRFQPLPEELQGALLEMVKPDSNEARGLSRTAEASLHVVLAAFAYEMEKRFDAGRLNVEVVERLISGGEGIAVAFEAVVKPILEGLFGTGEASVGAPNAKPPDAGP